MSYKMAPPPITVGYPANAGTAREAAMAYNNQNANLLNDLNKSGTGKGGRRTRRRKGGDGKIAVPLIQPLFNDPSAGTPQSVTSISLNTVGQHNQLSLNNAMTGSKVSPAQPIPPSQLKGGCGCDWKGGKRTGKRTGKRRGGTRIMGPNQTWGCYSGGKRTVRMTKRIKRIKRTKRTKRKV